MKVHNHTEQFDGAMHAWCGRGNTAVPSDQFEATDPALRCAACSRDWFPNGQPGWHLKQAQAVVQNQPMPKTAPTKPTRGGKREGAGRPAIDPAEETVTFSMRMTASQREKLQALGGGAWVRERIDKAKTEPARLRVGSPELRAAQDAMNARASRALHTLKGKP